MDCFVTIFFWTAHHEKTLSQLNHQGLEKRWGRKHFARFGSTDWRCTDFRLVPVSPILTNLYLNKLDKFVEEVLIPEYTKGKRRKPNPAYEKLMRHANCL